MKRYQKTKASQYIVIGLIVIAILAIIVFNAFIMRRVSFEDHFALPWAAGRAWLLEAMNPYQTEIAQIAEDAILDSPYKTSLPDNTELLMPFINLVFYLPFSLIPYTLSRLIWVTIISVSIVLITIFSLSLSNWKPSPIEKLISGIFILFWVPGITSILLGQLSPIIILLLLVSIKLLLDKQDTAAGFILALTAGSFTTSGLIIILMLIYGLTKRRWSIISAFFSGVAFILVVSLLLLPSWPGDFLRILVTNFSNSDFIQTPLISLAALLPGVERFLSIFLHSLFGLFFLTLVITTFGKSERVFIWNILATLIIAYFVNINGTIQHIFMIVPSMFLVFRFLSGRWGLFGRIFSWFFIFIFGIGSWLFFLPIETIKEPIGLPLIIFGLPLMAFIGMNWIRWWAIKIPKLPFETL